MTAADTQRQQVDLDPDAALWVQAYETAAAQEKHWADLKQQARSRLEQALGDAEVGLVDGQPRVRWTVVHSTRLDSKKLKEQDPELYRACTVEGISRRFTVAGSA